MSQIAKAHTIHLVTEDVTENGVTLTPYNSFMVQTYDYRLKRSRTETGKPYGPTLSVSLNCTLNTLTPDAGNEFYRRLQSPHTHPFTFLFGEKVGMVVRGYVVDIQESFSTSTYDDGRTKQMQMQVSILISEINYLGESAKRKLNLFS